MRPISAKALKIPSRSNKNQYDPFNQMSLLKTQNSGYQKNFQSYSALPGINESKMRQSNGFQESQTSGMSSMSRLPRPQSAKSTIQLKNKLVARPMSAAASRKAPHKPFQSIDPS